MKYVIAIERGNEQTAWGVVSPDIKGFSATSDKLEHLKESVIEGLAFFLECHAKSWELPPEGSTIEQWQNHPDYADFDQFEYIDIDIEKISESVNENAQH